jgi:hypothetical protein
MKNHQFGGFSQAPTCCRLRKPIRLTSLSTPQMRKEKEKMLGPMKYMDGTLVEPAYAKAVAKLVNSAATVEEMVGIDELEDFAGQQRSSHGLSLKSSKSREEILAANPNLISYRVSLHEEKGDKAILHFDCYAEDDESACDQAEDAYPNCEVLHATPFSGNN